MQLSDVLEEANRLRKGIPRLADTDPFTERTVYYYVQQGLLPRASRRRGPGTTYPNDFVDRLLFIRRLQKEQSLTLADIRQVMSYVQPATLRAVARGKEILDVRLLDELDDMPPGLESGEQRIVLDASDDYDIGSGDFFGQQDKRVHAAVLGRKRAGSVSTDQQKTLLGDERAAEGGERVQRRIPVGRHASLVVRKELTPLQGKRVEQVVRLLRSILEDDD